MMRHDTYRLLVVEHDGHEFSALCEKPEGLFAIDWANTRDFAARALAYGDYDCCIVAAPLLEAWRLNTVRRDTAKSRPRACVYLTRPGEHIPAGRCIDRSELTVGAVQRVIDEAASEGVRSPVALRRDRPRFLTPTSAPWVREVPQPL